MKFEVDKDLCIGCGQCQATCPEVFEIESDGRAHAYVDKVDEDLEADARDAMEGCPTVAISCPNDEE